MRIGRLLIAASCGIFGLAGTAASGQQPTPSVVSHVPTNANEMRQPNAPWQVPAFPGQTRAPVDEKGVQFNQTVWATGLDHPWALVFLPDGRGLVTERTGYIRYVNPDGTLSERLTGAPAVNTFNSSGLLDVVLDPKFKSNKRIYISYFAQIGDNSTLTVMRAELNGQALTNTKIIFQAEPAVKPAPPAIGGRMLFGKDGGLFIMIGDRFSSPAPAAEGFSQDYSYNQAQMLNSDLGKTVHIDTDGNPIRTNPFYGRKGARPEIYAYGQRSEEAIAFNPKTGDLWSIEFGPKGGDEINIIKPGKNYGWPVITYGIDYMNKPVLGNITQHEGMEQPIYYWDPVIDPSGAMFYTGDKFPAWKGSLFIGGLSEQLVRLTVDGDRVIGEERLLKDLRKRIRDVLQGPDGSIYIVTDVAMDGQIIRLTPKR